jgi:antitoxin ParD1/3/4
MMPTQNVSLTLKLEQFVKKQVAGGMFKSASEVHRVALASLMLRDEERQLRIKRLDAALQAGIGDLEEGRLSSISSEEEQDAFFKGIIKK